jgi:hypothetical protein
MDFRRSRVGWESPRHLKRGDLVAHLLKYRERLTNLLGEGVKFSHELAGRIRKIRDTEIQH